jgi:hypothetical protein
MAVKIGGRHQRGAIVENEFTLGDGLVITHVVSIRKALKGCRRRVGIV